MVSSRSASGFILLLGVLFSNCVECPPAERDRRASPDGAITAISYSNECGPVPPFNERVALTDGHAREDVATVLEAPITLSTEWRKPRALLMTFGCPPDRRAACLPAEGRNWSVRSKRRWRDVSIVLEVDEHLKSVATPEMLKRLLESSR
jgi:hypothetical protein